MARAAGCAQRGGSTAAQGGGRFKKLAQIFSNPKLPSLDDYYEPWTYEYDTLISAPLGEHTPGGAAASR